MLPTADIPAQRTGLAMGAIYRATLAEIEEDGFQVLRRRVALPKLRKIWIAWSTARRAARHRLPKAI
jgi:phytoene synthase